jgi:CRP/FNR family cyclic AMP-dependent transcriptional regulator
MLDERKNAFDANAFLAEIGEGRTIINYPAKQIIFSQGDPADAVFYLQKRTVKLTIISENGKEAVPAIFGPDEFFGEQCLVNQPRRLITATTLTECVVTRVAKAVMTRVIHEQTAFSEMFIAHLLARTLRIEADLIDQLFNSSEKRLARVLLLLANFGKEGASQPILAKISQETLAEMVGTTRPRISYFMNKFRKLGLVDYNDHITVHKSLLNTLLHERSQINRKS